MGWRKRRNDRVRHVKADRPLARSKELVVEELDGGLLIYDLRTHEAHSLSASAARVWRCCDGQTTVAALSSDAGVDPDTTERALAELEACRLLDSAEQGSTRREATVKLAKIGRGRGLGPPHCLHRRPGRGCHQLQPSAGPVRNPDCPWWAGRPPSVRGKRLHLLLQRGLQRRDVHRGPEPAGDTRRLLRSPGDVRRVTIRG
jgi:hypothetical protein